jgi:glyceraldehyde-3-phosphate dehydrogenase/erythrose-4-phosphate dehydrogenase
VVTTRPPPTCSLLVDGSEIAYSGNATPGAIPWEAGGVDIVLECTGAFKTVGSLDAHFERGVQKVIVAAPVDGERGAQHRDGLQRRPLRARPARHRHRRVVHHQQPGAGGPAGTAAQRIAHRCPSTMVVDGRLAKILIWYDNEYGYAFRLADLAALVGAKLPTPAEGGR